jgi:pimeloyl-ACP methyl ester carboxylesterase
VQERDVQAGSIRLAVVEAGEGGRPLMLVHGYGGAKEDFGEVLDRFAALGWHAVAPDLRGHGHSEYPPGEDDYGFDLFAADVLALADELGWDRFVLLGHSMGGMIVQHIITDHPDRVSALVLMDTAHGPLKWIDSESVELGISIVREHGVAKLIELQKQLEDPLTSPAHTRLVRERVGYEEFCDSKSLATAAPMRIAMMQAFINQDDRLEALGAIAVPTLVIVGEQDTPFLKASKRMADRIDGAKLAVIPKGGHSPQFEAPAEWWAAMEAFLESLPVEEHQ